MSVFLDGKEFEIVPMSDEHVKREIEDVAELQKEKIKVENDLDNKEVTQITRTFIKDEYSLCSSTGVADTVSDSTGNGNDFTEAWIKCEALEELKVENDLDTETCGNTEMGEEYIIKNENGMAQGSRKLSVCIHCHQTFTRKFNLGDHIIKKHPEYIATVSSKIHECKYCVFKTTSTRNFSRHMERHPGAEGGCEPKMCIHCDAKFKSRTRLNDHIIEKHPEYIASVANDIYECQYCVFKTTSTHNLNRHMEKHPGAEGGREPKICIHCDAKFKSKASLDDHVIKKHPEDMASVTSKIHECKYCEFKTTARSNLRSHVGKHPGAEGGWQRKTCVHCNRTFSNKICLHDHIVRDHPGYITTVSSKVYECIYCVHKTTSKYKFDRHMLKHRDFAPDVSSKMYECAHCTYKTVFKSSLAIHLLKHPGANSSYKLKKCVHCDATFKTGLLLGNHIIKKHPDFVASISFKIHECTHCTHKTTSKGRLAIHMLKHPGAKSSHKLNVCTHCDATFIYKKSLNDHIIKKHPEHTASVSSKILECTHCTYKTTFKSLLTKHMFKHPDAKSSHKLSVCSHCNTTFINKKSLNDHIVKKHPEHTASVSSKIFECKYCTFKTTLKGCLTRHMGKHPEAGGGCALKTCNHCNAAFRSKRCLDNHTIKTHPEYIESVSSKIHGCAHCTYKTTAKKGLDNHLRKVHKGKHPGAGGSGKLMKNRKRKQ